MYYFYTYKIVSEMPEKPYYYYGFHCTSKLEDGYLGSGLRLRRAYNKYGTGAFRKEILNFYNSFEEVSKAEVDLIEELYTTDLWCLNLRSGGKGGSSKGDWNSERKDKISKIHKGKTAWNKNIPLPTEQKELMGRTRLKNIAEGNYSYDTEDYRQKLKNSAKFRPSQSLETKTKRSLSMKGVLKSEIHRRNLSLSTKTRKLKNCPYCSKEVQVQTYNRWHGEKCKLKETV
jgi:hypothetical protein